MIRKTKERRQHCAFCGVELDNGHSLEMCGELSCSACYKRHEGGKRPKVDDNFCFCCQKEPPTWEATKEDKETFLLCDSCKSYIERENLTNNAVKMALAYPENGKQIFTQTLGFKLDTIQFRFRRLS
jgi:hypothetical protein